MLGQLYMSVGTIKCVCRGNCMCLLRQLCVSALAAICVCWDNYICLLGQVYVPIGTTKCVCRGNCMCLLGPGMGSITLKSNSLHYNYFGNMCH